MHASKKCVRADGSLYFAYTGWLIAVLLAITLAIRVQLGVYGWMFTKQLLAEFALVALCATGAALFTFFRPVRIWMTRVVRIGFDLSLDGPEPKRTSVSIGSSLLGLLTKFGWLAYLITALILLKLDHRLYILAIAALQAAAIFALRPELRRIAMWPIILLSIVTWALGSGLTYTHLGDFLLNISPPYGFAIPAFLITFALTTIELTDGARNDRQTMNPRWILIAAMLVFSAFAFRTDLLFANWVPYHRSFFADTAQSVHDGNWLLWNVPSLYGFLSILTLAFFPASNAWQATYELTGIFLTLQATFIFFVLRYGRTGWINLLFAIAVPIALLLNDGIVRYGFSSRLYPQGGLRFFWIDAILATIIALYLKRAQIKQVHLLRWCGHIVWLLSLLWSLEVGAWVTVVWLGYLSTDALTAPLPPANVGIFLQRLVHRLWPLAVLPPLVLAGITLYYRHALGHGPDWYSFVEYAGFFAAGKIRSIFYVQAFGAGWSLVLTLGAAGTLGIAAIIGRRWPLVPLLVAGWLAAWVACSYFALEPLDEYVALILGVHATVIALVIFCSHEGWPNKLLPLVTRLSLAPTIILSLAMLLGQTGRMSQMTFPFTANWQPNVLSGAPRMSPELRALLRRADVKPTDRVLFPNRDYWTELRQGLILPIGRSVDGRPIFYRSWLPTSPVGPEMLLQGLPKSRQATYIARTLALGNGTGWYVTYREAADCSRLSPSLRTSRQFRSPNFAISWCSMSRP